MKSRPADPSLAARARIHTSPDELFAPLVELLAESVAARVTELLELPAQAEPYLTREEAALYIGATPKRISDLRREGAIRTVKDGSRLLTKRSWLDAYLEGKDEA
ncbi:MAG: helix-turn-helix domain-containing protein [Actinomycetota bacterium]|nr:helix-turn-helix domain-containing protein [Actinomycetota bacterium]